MSDYSSSTPPVLSPSYDAPPPAPRSSRTGCLLGCLGALVLCLLLCGGAGIWAYYYVPLMLAQQARNVIVQIVEDSELSPEDKQAVTQQVDRVVEAYRSGQINGEGLMKILEDLADSPLMGSLLIYAMEEQYIDASGLSDEEKQAARRTLERIARGVSEGKIEEVALEEALEPVMESDDDGQSRLKDQVTDEELRTALSRLKDLADGAGIPDEPYEINIAEEVKRIVDKRLGE